MNINDISKINHKKNSINIKKKYIKNLITRTLLSLILFMVIAISFKLDKNNINYIKKFIFTDTIKFTKINNWYQNKIGKLIPDKNMSSETVFSSDNIINRYEKYCDGIKIEEEKDNPISSIYGGIVVFIGNKDNYSNTVIIQGNDGIDYWYGNIDNINVNLYDYIEKDTIIGNAKENYIYLVLEKEGKYLDYDEYLKKDKD